MKKLLLYLILVSYAIVMIKPVMPYVSDAIGHAIFYSQHMATLHYENGAYHVHAELSKNIKEENSEKTPSSTKKQSSNQEHINVQQAETDFAKFFTLIKYSLPPSSGIASGTSKYNYPPPRA